MAPLLRRAAQNVTRGVGDWPRPVEGKISNERRFGHCALDPRNSRRLRELLSLTDSTAGRTCRNVVCQFLIAKLSAMNIHGRFVTDPKRGRANFLLAAEPPRQRNLRLREPPGAPGPATTDVLILAPKPPPDPAAGRRQRIPSPPSTLSAWATTSSRSARPAYSRPAR